MSVFQTARTVRYTGADADEVRRAYAVDSERALTAGYVVMRSRWEPGGGSPALLVDYVHASVTGPESPGPAPAQAGRRGGLAEALLLVGAILAGMIALAVAIPAAAPVATPVPASPAATVVPSV